MQDFVLHESNKKQFWQILQQILPTGKRWRIKITEYREKRSLPQNSLMWVWNTQVAEQLTATGVANFIDEEVHEWLKDMFCPAKPVTIAGLTRYIKSTRLLDTAEMHHYLSEIDRWAHQKGLRLTIPGDSEYQALKDKQNQ